MDRRWQAGFSAAELLAVLFLLGIVASIAAPMLLRAEAPLESGTVLVQSHFRQVRARAMATTSAYRITRPAPDRLSAEWADRCSALDWTAEPSLDLELPEGVSLVESGFALCFSSRGIAAQNMILTLVHDDYGQQKIEVLLGGTTRLLP